MALKILGGIVGAFIILALVLIVIEHFNTGVNSFTGSENPITGEWCDYGFSAQYQSCCDEDDYSCEICSYNHYDCEDFTDQVDAQSIYDECVDFDTANKDVHDLDRDNDRIACESLLTE